MIGNRNRNNSVESKENQNNEDGIIPLAIRDCFKLLKRREDSRAMSIHVSYLEIYNEEYRDLLSNIESVGNDQYISSSLNANVVKKPEKHNLTTQGTENCLCNSCGSIDIFETANGTILRGLTEVSILNADEALDILSLGEIKREIGYTEANSNSSRSHSIFRISVSYTDATYCTVSLVDLAGSESVKITKSDGKRRSEGNYINKSLTTLGIIIRKLAENLNSDRSSFHHIPYRDSKLTRIMKNALSGRAQLSVICTVSSAEKDLNDTRSTIDFASRCKSIKVNCIKEDAKAKVDLTQEYVQQITLLRDQLSQYKTELSMEKLLRTQSNNDLENTKSELKEALKNQISQDQLESLVNASISLEKLISRLTVSSPSFTKGPIERQRDNITSQDCADMLRPILKQVGQVIERHKTHVSTLTDSILASCPSYILEGYEKMEESYEQDVQSDQTTEIIPYESIQVHPLSSFSNNDRSYILSHAHITSSDCSIFSSFDQQSIGFCKTGSVFTEQKTNSGVFFLPVLTSNKQSSNFEEYPFKITTCVLVVILPLFPIMIRFLMSLCILSQLASLRKQQASLTETLVLSLEVLCLHFVVDPIFTLSHLICVILLIKMMISP